MGDDEAPDPKPDELAGAPKPKSRRKDKEALPFAEDTERLDGRAWNRKPLVVFGVVLAVAAVIVLLVLAFNSVSGGDDDDGGGGNAPPAVVTTTSTAPTTTSSTSTTTTSTTAPPPTTAALADNACSPEEGNPDCIDPDGDGDYQLLQGGASCLATAETPRDCIDTNHDGSAGPPATAD